MSKKAIILFSGGLDSTTVFAMAKSQGYECYPLTFSYGQRHHIEVEVAKKIAKKFVAKEHRVVRMEINQWGGSALTDLSLEVPHHASNGIPITYVPARNTIFLATALSWGEAIGVQDIFIGVNSVDYSSYPDCRPEFLEAFQTLADLATRASVEGKLFRIHAPLLKLNKAEIIREGIRLDIDYSLTLSCYDPNIENEACGECDSCRFRAKGFLEAGVSDPTKYSKKKKHHATI